MKPSGSALRAGTVAIGSRAAVARGAMSIRARLKISPWQTTSGQESSRLIRLFEPLRARVKITKSLGIPGASGSGVAGRSQDHIRRPGPDARRGDPRPRPPCAAPGAHLLRRPGSPPAECPVTSHVRRQPAPPMKLLFLILAHDRPEEAAELARTLVAAATDAGALIHFDARAGRRPSRRSRRRWRASRASAWSPSAPPAPGAASAWSRRRSTRSPRPRPRGSGWAPDYVILLSGACLPCRPVASLERFLTENAGREFIESEDESWITGGWRSERWRFWHWFDHKTQRPPAWSRAASRRRSGCGGASLPGSSRASARSGGR